MNRSTLSRLRRLEARLGAERMELPTLFVSIDDCSVPDPDIPCVEQHDFSDSTVVGYYALPGGTASRRVTRAPQERIEDLQARASRADPGVRVWMAAYAGHESFDNFAAAQEIS